MISVDLETSGIDFNKCGILQIGAIDLETGEEFMEECKIDDEDEIVDEPTAKRTVFETIGKTEEELRDKNKQTQKELLQKFFDWVKTSNERVFLCQNPQFDMASLWSKARKYELEIPFQHRAFDLHSIAQTKYQEMNKEFKMKNGKSNMGLSKVCELCGLKYTEGFHDGLSDAKITAECFFRLVKGEKHFEEFKEYEIPKELLE